jgi:hypothetical protein
VSPLNAQIDGMNVGLTVNLQQSVSYVDQDKPGRAGSLSFDVLRKLFDYGFMRGKEPHSHHGPAGGEVCR